MSISSDNQASYSQWLQDVTETSTLPANGESFTGAHVQEIIADVDAIKYILGKPGLREGSVFVASNTALLGVATSSLTSLVFSVSQTAITVGSLVAGASPTSTGWRRVTAWANGLTATVDRAFDTNLAAEQAYLKGTVAKRIADLAASGATVARGHISGLTLSNNGTDPTNDIDIAAGQAADSTGAVYLSLASTRVKRLDASWATGTNQGGLSSSLVAGLTNTTYHVFIIRVAGVDDIGFDTSVTAANLIADHSATHYARIGSIMRSGAAIRAFKQRGKRFDLDVCVNNRNTSNPGTSAVLQACTVPTGIKVLARFSYITRNVATNHVVLFTDPDQTDTVPSATLFSMRAHGASAMYEGGEFEIVTDTSAQIRLRWDASGAGDDDIMTTHGWTDYQLGG